MTESNETPNAERMTTKKKQKPIERVTIEDNLKAKLNHLVALANQSLQGVAEVNRTDIMNLILKMHADELSSAETEELRRTHFDVFKCLTWLQHEAKNAKEKGSQISLKELLEKSSELMKDDLGQVGMRRRKPRAKKTKDVSPANLDPSLNVGKDRS